MGTILSEACIVYLYMMVFFRSGSIKTMKRVFPVILTSAILYSLITGFSNINPRIRTTDFHSGNDTMVSFAKRYMAFIDNIGSKRQSSKKVYVKQNNHPKYRFVPDLNHWPDSIEKTVNIIYYKGEVVSYIEIPLAQSGDTYEEYDWYFYKGCLISSRIIYLDYHSACTTNRGLLSEKTFICYDSLQNIFSKEFSAVDGDNNKVDLSKCRLAPIDKIPVYKTISETPFIKSGVEGK